MPSAVARLAALGVVPSGRPFLRDHLRRPGRAPGHRGLPGRTGSGRPPARAARSVERGRHARRHRGRARDRPGRGCATDATSRSRSVGSRCRRAMSLPLTAALLGARGPRARAATTRPTEVRAPPALRGRSVGRPRRGALVRRRRALRHAGGRGRGRGCGPDCGPRSVVRLLARGVSRGGTTPVGRRGGVRGPGRRAAASSAPVAVRRGGCCSSVTRPATSTRSRGRGSRSASRGRRRSSEPYARTIPRATSAPGGRTTRRSRLLTLGLLRASQVRACA